MPILNSLRRALTLNFLLVASIPVLLFGLLNLQLLTQHQLEGVRERNMLQARSIAEEVEASLLEMHSALLNVEETIDSGMITQPADIDEFLAGVVRNSQFFESIYLLDSNCQLLHLGLLPKIQSIRNDYVGLDFSGHQIFQADKELNEPVWSDTYISLVTGEPSVTLGFSTSQGFLLGNIRLNSLGKLLQRHSTYGGVEAAVIDRSGTLIAHNVTEMAMQQLNFGNHPGVILAMEGQETTQEFTQGADYYLESVARITNPDWVVWVGLDMNAILAPIHNTRNLLIAFMVASIVLACFLALLNGRRLMRPLTAIGQRARQIADGNYDFSYRASGFSEIDDLASHIKNMSHAIKVREESIVASEQRFRDLVNSIDGIVWEMEYPTFRFLFVSKQAEHMLGYPAQDWYEDSFWEEKTHAEDIRQAKAYCQLMSEKHEDHDFEYRMIGADGRVVWIRDLVTVVVEDDRPVRLLGVMIDITAQKELLNELKRSEENYRQIFNATSDAIFIHDAETGQVLDVNQAMLNMFNCSYEDVLADGIALISADVGPYSFKEAQAKLVEAREKGGCSFEWRSRKATGEQLWIEVSLRSAMIGNQQRILATVRDISERKEAIGKIREANERLSLLIERMPLGCILWAPDFVAKMWNPAAEAIFGFKEDEMIGRGPLGTILPEEAGSEVEPTLARFLTGDTSAHSVNENLTKSGKRIICEWYNTPLLDVSGKNMGVISMVQDISDRKAAEDELAEYRAHLEDIVRERSAQLEIAQEELMQKERLAVLGQLTATVSHEIRNPLGTIANSLFLLKGALSGEEHESLSRPLLLAERNVERCDDIITDLLDFSRQRMIQKEPLDIDAWFTELLQELSFPEGVLCRWNLASQATVLADSERLRRVMVNVITNALQALDEVPDAGKTLEVQSVVLGGRCEIHVRDNGPGMSQETMARIYEPMFSTKNFGVGLGVPIIKSIMQGHGGGVEYQSEPGQGTAVLLWLPLVNENTA